jgi:flavin-dependent dehydrogenase
VVEKNVSIAGASPQTSRRIWDAIVIGAGPAGAVAAHQLAKQGLATLLVERQAWPRQKVCGGCLNGQALSVLKGVGLERIFDEYHAATVSQLIVQARHRRAEVDLLGGLAVNRLEFDAALVSAAIDAGVEFLPATKAAVVPEVERSQVRQVSLSGNDENCRTATGRVVIAADGLGHPSLKALPEFSCQIDEGARVGISIVIEQMPESYRAGAIYMAISRSGYVGLVRTKDGNGNLAAAIDLAAIKLAADPAAAVRLILADAGMPAPTFFEKDMWRGTIPLTRRENRLSTNRVLLLGDAAGYAEPFTGEGIGWAMSSAVGAAPIVVSNLQRWDVDVIGEWETRQRRQMLRGQVVCRTMAYLLRRPMAVHLALRALGAIPGLARPLVRRVYKFKRDSGMSLT